MLKMALFDCAINEKCCSVDGGRGICPLFSSPPQGIWQLKSPHRREFAIQNKKNANARGQPRGLGGGGWGGRAQVEYKNIKFINGQLRITVNFILYRKLTFLVSGTYWLKDQVVTLAADDGVVSIFQAKSLLKRRVSAVNLKESWNSITLGGYPSIKKNSNSNKNTLKRHCNVSWKW